MSKAFTLRGIAFSAFFAALVVVFGYISIPLGFTPVPITLQTLAVMLAGGMLGARYGFISMLIVVVLTALGLPMLQGKGGLSVLFGPTGGYVVMWPFAAMLVGLTISRMRAKGWLGYILLFLSMEVFGSLLLYVSGVPWLAYSIDLTLPEAMVAGCYPYLIGDAIKAVAATVITISLRQVFPQERLTGQSQYGVRQRSNES